MKKSLQIFAAALFAGGLTFAAGVGQAAQASNAPRTVAVHYGDLDLGSAAGRDALDRRIGQAIRTACGTASPADLAGQNDAAACRAALAASLAGQRDAALAANGTGPAAILAARR